jgi:Xaa-Pro aminopeptidase
MLRPLGPSFYTNVRDRLRVRAEAARVDGLLLLAPGNVRYATGWHFSVNERPVGLWLPISGDPLLFVPLLELENALEVQGVEVRTYEEYPGERPPVLWMLEEVDGSVAIDTLDARLLAAAETVVDRVDLADHVLSERAIKTDEELALIREAARFADVVLERLLSAGGRIIADGGTEVDLMADCTGHARRLLMETHGVAFQGTKLGITASVHSGPRAALPHGSVLPRRPQRGEPIIAGIGCSLGGYHAESGVTLVCGEPDTEQRRVMETMAAANQATVDALANGLPCAEVNDAALRVVRTAGFGDAIRHRIGHGMGVDGHEAPWLAPGDPTPVASGMVFSCEPGIYRPDLDGWRTIETLIVGADGVEVASRFQTMHPLDSRTLPC